MPVANNLFTGAILAPLITFRAAISLATVQRGIEWIGAIAKNVEISRNSIIVDFINENLDKLDFSSNH